MTPLRTLGPCIYGVLLPIAVLVTVSRAQQPSQCPTEECNIRYRAQLEEVNQALRTAVEQVNRTLAEQKSLINKWRTCGGNNDTQPTPEYTVEKLASLEPCNHRVGTTSRIQGITQLEGVIFVLCMNSHELRAYDGSTFQALPNVTLPTAKVPGKMPHYIIANNFDDKALYLGVLSQDPQSLTYYKGYDIWRMDMSLNWALLSTASPDPTHNVFRLRVARNGQLMYANSTHILFPDSPSTYTRAIKFAKPPLGEIDFITGLVETKNGSFVIFAEMQTYLIRVNANGDYAGKLADGLVAPTNDNLTSINDLEQGPDEKLLISDVMNDRIVIVDGDRNRMSELIHQVVNGTRTTKLWRPDHLSYDPESQLLVVGEYSDRSQWSVTTGEGSIKVFRIKRTAQPVP